MLRDVQTPLLIIIRYTKAHRHVKGLEDDHGNNEGVNGDDDHRDDLVGHQASLAAEEAVYAADCGTGEEAGREATPEATHAVHGDNVERVVETRADA